MGASTLVEIESMVAELPNIIDNKIYEARQDAWLSACEWIISLNGDGKVDCKKAFDNYIKSLKQ